MKFVLEKKKKSNTLPKPKMFGRGEPLTDSLKDKVKGNSVAWKK